MKKILLLGGSAQQVIAIEKAKKLGFFTILCDYLSDNPGRLVADKFYLISTTDKEKVLQIALDESIDGVIAYSSDPAAPTAAYVAESLNLPGLSYEAVNTLCNKDLFRPYLINNGFNSPKSFSFEYTENATNSLCNFDFPVIVKPTDSSGSKGVSVVYNLDNLKNAIKYAFSFSRNGKLIVEEFIQRDHPEVIEAEIFVVNGSVSIWGLISSIRDSSTNPLIPAAYSYPINLPESRINLVKLEINKLISSLNVFNGAFNLEMIITKENKLYFLDVGPRNGGNLLPEFISKISKVDLTEASILASVGELDRIKFKEFDGLEGGFWGLYVIHSKKKGLFKGVLFEDSIAKYLINVNYFINEGSIVQKFNKSNDAIGLALFNFPNEEIRNKVLNDFDNKFIRIMVE